MKLKAQAAIEYLFMVAVVLIIVLTNYQTLTRIAKSTASELNKFTRALQQSLQEALQQVAS